MTFLANKTPCHAYLLLPLLKECASTTLAHLETLKLRAADE